MSIQDALSDTHATRLEEAIGGALQCLERGELADADRLCAQALASSPDDYDVLSLRAIVEARQGRHLAAMETVNRILALRPDDPNALRHRADIEELRIKSAELPYARRYMENRAIHLDYPRTISIETIGRCNAKCNFCPAPELERRNEVMSDELFRKIIRDIQEIPPDVPLNINTNVVNEPFMDRKMFARLRQINEALPAARIQIYSNFNVLPRNFMARFREIKNIGNLNISFNAANEADYTAIMHVDFGRTVRHLKTFMAGNRQDRFLEQPIILSRVADNTKGDQEYFEQCRALFSEFQEGVDYLLYVKRRVTWVGDSQVAQSDVPYFLPCDAWLDMNIMCTGVVPLCCLDAEGDHAIGDVTRNSVLEIYNTPRFRNLREHHLQREGLNPCGTCSPYAATREDPKHLTFRTISVPIDSIRVAARRTD